MTDHVKIHFIQICCPITCLHDLFEMPKNINRQQNENHFIFM